MVTFPNAKINLGLNVIEKRQDGYHNIETVFYPIGWCDILEIVSAEKKINRKSDVQFKTTGTKIIGSNKNNLCIKAYELLKEKYGLPPVQMHLHKLVPIGAGLGGGSSDAASTLTLLNKIFGLKISTEELEKLASSLGADCAFFIRNKPLFASGKGDVFEDLSISLKNYFITVVKPEVHISTEMAYRNMEISGAEKASIKEIIIEPVARWRDLLVNDFEKNAFKKHPLIKHIKDELYHAGAVYASMSGSGSAVYGIFEKETDLESKFSGYAVWSGKME